MNSIKIANILSIILMSLHCLGGGCSAEKFSGVDPGEIRTAMINKGVSIYKPLYEVPTLLSARISKTRDGDIMVDSKWAKGNLDRLTTQKFARHHRLNSNHQVVFESFPDDVSTELLEAYCECPNNELKAVLRQTTTDCTVKQCIEVHYRDGTMKHYDLSAYGVHDGVYTDSTFGSFEWSPDCTRLLYIAEKKLPKSEPFYDPAEKSSSETKRSSVNVTKGNQYVYKPDWGEGLDGKRNSLCITLDINRDKVTVLPGVPDELSPGHVSWAPDGQGVIGVAWQHEPIYLGLKGSMRIHSWIFLLKNGTFSKISNDGNAVWSPRLSTDRTRLVWMERNFSLPHHNNYRLMAATWNQSTMSKPEIIIDIIGKSVTISDGKEFFGMYWLEHARRCWSNDSNHMLFSTVQYATMKSYSVNIEKKIVTEIDTGNTSSIVLDVCDDWIALKRSSFVSSDQLVLLRFDPSASNLEAMNMIEVTTPSRIEELKNLDYKIIKYTYDNDDEVKDFNFVYLGPRSGEKASIPLIVWPHGGPQGASYDSFKLEAVVYARSGFGIVFVNYRGSAGMGADNLEYLRGNVGVSDVIDMVTAIEEACRMFPWLDSARTACYGGSYGGFAVAHLTGQHPMLCKAAVMKAPMTEMVSMKIMSDTPDLPDYLVGSDHDPSNPEPPDAETYAKMYAQSPFAHVLDVITPTLLHVGKFDSRTPFSQARMWHDAIRKNGGKSKLLVYEDNHSLSAPSTLMDLTINSLLWLKEHCTSPDPA